MARTERPAFVAVYFPGQPIKLNSQSFMKYEEARLAVAEGRGIFRDHRRKIVLAAKPHEVSDNHISQRSDSALNREDAQALAFNNRLPKWRRERIEAWKAL